MGCTHSWCRLRMSGNFLWSLPQIFVEHIFQNIFCCTTVFCWNYCAQNCVANICCAQYSVMNILLRTSVSPKTLAHIRCWYDLAHIHQHPWIAPRFCNWRNSCRSSVPKTVIDYCPDTVKIYKWVKANFLLTG